MSSDRLLVFSRYSQVEGGLKTGGSNPPKQVEGPCCRALALTPTVYYTRLILQLFHPPPLFNCQHFVTESLDEKYIMSSKTSLHDQLRVRAALGDCSRFCSSVKILSTIDFPRPSQLADTHTGPPGAIFKMLLRHTDTQTHRHTDTQTHRHTDTQTHRHTDRFVAWRNLATGLFGMCSENPKSFPTPHLISLL